MPATVKIEPKLLNKISKIAKDENTTENQIITQMIKEWETTKNKGKIKARKINDKMPFYDPDKKANSNDMVGIIELDYETDAVELKDEIHTKNELY